MKNLSRVKAYQQKLYSALGIEWRENLFNDRWLTLYGQDWDKLAERGLIENDFCALCGNDELKSGYYRIPAFSYYKVRLPICDNCWEEKGYGEVAQAQENFNFGKSRWYKILPTYFQPDESVIQEVENFRSRFSLEHDFLAQMISITPWSVKKLQWFMLKKIRTEQPTWPEKEIWKSVIISRMNVKLMTADFPPDIDSTPLSRAEINDIIKQATTIVKDFKSFVEVVNYLLEIDYKENRFYDPGRLLDDLNNILENISKAT